ncbi:MAG: hypothetical protein JWO19_1223 [Bryobacterales bacterium]|jgi:hypothetical protein|nr:hypothetical protein [Bryobacterales bacterium]
MHTYTAYGLHISSEVPLLEFLAGDPLGDAAADVLVRYGIGEDWIGDVTDREYHLAIEHREARFWFKEVGGFVVRDGKTIELMPIPGADESLIRLYIEGMVMAMLLYQRGFCVLHASVVDIDGHAVAFLGHVGAGKSSLAAALQARGHAVISDDNAAVRVAAGQATVEPAYPFLKLFPEIASSLGYRTDQLRVLHSSQKKVAGVVAGKFAAKARRLERLYILGREHPPEIRSLGASQLILELIRNSVPTRWGCTADGDHLRRCGTVAQHVNAFTVRTFDRLDSLPELAERLELHCTAGDVLRDNIPIAIRSHTLAMGDGAQG